MDGVDHLVRDGEDAVEARVSHQVAECVVVVPTSSLVRRPVDGGELLQDVALCGAESDAIHPPSVEIMVDEDGAGVVIDMVDRLVDLAAGESAEVGELLLVFRILSPKVAKGIAEE